MPAVKGTKVVEVKFVLDQPKKHSVLYREVAEDPTKQVLRSLYVSNEACATLGNPKGLVVTIAAV